MVKNLIVSEVNQRKRTESTKTVKETK